MAGWAIRERIKSPAALVDFDHDGYAYTADRSSPDAPVFTRRND
jgi:cytoplasmic iron level regulating protein YaaA (DUF328/UPF0246 family)